MKKSTDRRTQLLLIAVVALLSHCSEGKHEPAAPKSAKKAADTLVPPTISPEVVPFVILRDTLEPPTIVPVPNRAYTYTVPNYIRYANNPLPPILDMKHPSVRQGGFYPRFRKLNATNGLPGDYVLDIFFDKYGELWLTIWGHGLVRYDGSQASVIKKIDRGNPFPMYVLGGDQEGNIWTIQGKYNGRNITRSGMDDSIYRYRPNQMVEDEHGTKWFLKSLDSIFKFSHGKLEVLSHKEGLAGTFLFSIYADRRNSIWIGADTCLNRYNGKSFDIIPQRKGLVEGIARSICEDSKGNLWFATSKGLVKYDGKQFTTFTETDGLPANQLWSVTADTDDNIWAGTDNGVCKYDGKIFRTFGQAEGIPGKVNQVVSDPAGGVWFWGIDFPGVMNYTGDAIEVFRGNSGLYDDADNSESLLIFSTLEDSLGHYWFGGAGFAYYYDGNSFTHYGKENGILVYGSERARILSILSDKSGKTWFGIQGGNISVFDGASFTHLTQGQKIGTRFINYLYLDRLGRVWGSYYDYRPKSNKIFCMDGNRILHYGEAHGLIEDNIVDIFEDSRGNLWFGGEGGGLSFFSGKRFFNFNFSSGLASNIVRRIVEDDTGNIIIATAGGLSVIRKEKLLVLDSLVKQIPYKNLFENYTVKEGLISSFLWDVQISSGNIFIGTADGLTVLKGGLGKPGEGIPRNRIEHFNHQNGYPIPAVYRLAKDSKGVIWVSTSNLVRFDYNRLDQTATAPVVSLRRIGLHNETLSWYNLSGASSKNPDYVTDSADISVLTTDELMLYGATLTDDERSKMVGRFSGIRFDRIVPFLNIPYNLRLPYRHNNIQINFAAIAPARPEKIRYQYRLQGQDTAWGNVTEKVSASYGPLPEGKYRFLVRAMALSPNSPWSEPMVYAFEVLPPWYRTWWAYLTYTLVALALITALVRWRTSALKKDRQRLEHQVMERTRELVVAKEQVEESLTELKTTQQELIQREKMASLGELTAGIAHEIQNPLNFVNNFSEVNKELIGEMRQELDAGNSEEAKFISKDIEDNQDKIILHGQRADAIVKSMLQHSRSGSGKKEPTDINALADEYLRLAFHGMRAKDKTFNAVLHTDFDASLEKINVIPQDIGRVLLNLVNNAFYAVHEKKQSAPDGYEPAVSLSTKKTDNKIVITVKDNGNGIPDKIKDKIFQPFFTTKPTGKGTGLGLSLSYDIVKAHGGEIRVESQLGEGSNFNIVVPANINI